MEIEKKENSSLSIDTFGWSMLFWIYFSINLLSNVDCGVIPAAMDSIKYEFNLNQLKIGMLGSLVYAGVVGNTIYFILVGCLFSGSLYRCMKSKSILTIFLLLHIFTLVSFSYSYHFYLLCLFRFLSGFCKVIYIYWLIDFPINLLSHLDWFIWR